MGPAAVPAPPAKALSTDGSPSAKRRKLDHPAKLVDHALPLTVAPPVLAEVPELQISSLAVNLTPTLPVHCLFLSSLDADIDVSFILQLVSSVLASLVAPRRPRLFHPASPPPLTLDPRDDLEILLSLPGHIVQGPLMIPDQVQQLEAAAKANLKRLAALASVQGGARWGWPEYEDESHMENGRAVELPEVYSPETIDMSGSQSQSRSRSWTPAEEGTTYQQSSSIPQVSARPNLTVGSDSALASAPSPPAASNAAETFLAALRAVVSRHSRSPSVTSISPAPITQPVAIPELVAPDPHSGQLESLSSDSAPAAIPVMPPHTPRASQPGSHQTQLYSSAQDMLDNTVLESPQPLSVAAISAALRHGLTLGLAAAAAMSASKLALGERQANAAQRERAVSESSSLTYASQSPPRGVPRAALQMLEPAVSSDVAVLVSSDPEGRSPHLESIVGPWQEANPSSVAPPMSIVEVEATASAALDDQEEIGDMLAECNAED